MHLHFLKTPLQLRPFQLLSTYILTGSVSQQDVFCESYILKISEMFTRVKKVHILHSLYAKAVSMKDKKKIVKGDPFLLAICDPSCCIKEPENKQLIGF